jgi:hypothetical protein
MSSEQLKLTRTTKLLIANGYRLVEDPFNEHGHLTYIRDDNADRPFHPALSHALRYAGWQADNAVPPVYRLPSAGLMIEIEPGGADIARHYLHLTDIRGERDRARPVRAAFDRVKDAMSSAFGFLRLDEEKRQLVYARHGVLK